ncbi:uncharacterized protein CXorf58-like isoform X1 [Clavelina lepadiformis]|uniref:uncharacterized protein CXorf58-like isoform X1 n=2 Tax=Clavelina lepadiformis TaxID=159417 RepID=UPI004041905E
MTHSHSQSQYDPAKEIENMNSDYRMKSLIAAATIERAYLSYRDRQMFILLKHAVRAAEQSWTYDILRKISPKEAELLNDPSVKARVRFRFGGTEFPPIILFKIYLTNNGTKYISGKRIIRPATNAASDACKLMGHRKFYDQMIIDACQFEKDKITDEVDVTTVKDYMQYLSNMDETPSYLGGKENYWRQLSLEVLPRQSIMYDIIEYLKTKSPSQRLQNEMPVLLSRPVTQEVQLEQFRVISRLPSPPSSAYPFIKAVVKPQASGGATQRRSVQSRRRVAKMKKMYGMDSSNDHVKRDEAQDLTVRATSSLSRQVDIAENLSHPATTSPKPTAPSTVKPSTGVRRETRPAPDVEPEEQEARALYEWTCDLNLDEINKGIFPSSASRPESAPRSVSFSSQLTKRVYAT